jgi:hypothetical protein
MLVWWWLVQGRAGGSKQLTTEGKVADQARPSGLRSADLILWMEYPHSEERRGGVQRRTSRVIGLVDPRPGDDCI